MEYSPVPQGDEQTVKKAKKKTSPVWQYFKEVGVNLNECQLCGSDLASPKSSTGAMVGHLKTQHSEQYSLISHAFNVRHSRRNRAQSDRTFRQYQQRTMECSPATAVTVTQDEELPVEVDKANKKTSPVWQYFKHIGDNINECQLCGSDLVTSLSSTGVLVRHLKTQHSEQYNLMLDALNALSSQRPCNVAQSTEQCGSSLQTTSYSTESEVREYKEKIANALCKLDEEVDFEECIYERQVYCIFPSGVQFVVERSVEEIDAILAKNKRTESSAPKTRRSKRHRTNSSSSSSSSSSSDCSGAPLRCSWSGRFLPLPAAAQVDGNVPGSEDCEPPEALDDEWQSNSNSNSGSGTDSDRPSDM